MEATLIAIGAFIPMLVMLVVIHEWGHFATAKAFGVKVMEFGIGYPPRAFGLYTGKTTVLVDEQTQWLGPPAGQALAEGAAADPTRPQPGQFARVSSTEDAQGNLVARSVEVVSRGRGRQAKLQETGDDDYLHHEGPVRQITPDSLVIADMVYSINWLPLGGFVRLAGENNPATPRSLARKSPGARAIVLAAGAFMNAIFPVVVFTLLFMIPQNVTVGQVAIAQVADNSPAQSAGVRPGDVVARAGGREIEHSSHLIRSVAGGVGSEMEWTIHRNGQTEIVRLTPRARPPEGQGATGVQIELINQRQERQYQPPWQAVVSAFVSVWDLLTLLKQEISGWITGSTSPQLSGPVGIAQITGEVTQQGGLRGWLVLSILFSINLAILNLLPIPMLDGGRLVFVGLEWIRGGKRIPPRREGIVHLIGLVALMGLILAITYNDIMRLLQGGNPLGG